MAACQCVEAVGGDMRLDAPSVPYRRNLFVDNQIETQAEGTDQGVRLVGGEEPR